DGRFLSFDGSLLDVETPPYQDGWLPNTSLNGQLPWALVNAQTVNTASGQTSTILSRTNRGAQIESMEGAAFHQVMIENGSPFIQIRGISNLIEPRNKERWKMDLALKNLSSTLQQYLNTLLK